MTNNQTPKTFIYMNDGNIVYAYDPYDKVRAALDDEWVDIDTYQELGSRWPIGMTIRTATIWRIGEVSAGWFAAQAAAQAAS